MEFREPKKGQQMVQILMKTIVICDSLGVIILWYTVHTQGVQYGQAEYFYFVCYSDFIGLFIVYLKKEERVYKSEKQCENASFL